MSLLVQEIRQKRNELARHEALIAQHNADIELSEDKRPKMEHQKLIEHHEAESEHIQRVIKLLSTGLTAEEKLLLDPPKEGEPVQAPKKTPPRKR
jgi:hypothetical protein